MDLGHRQSQRLEQRQTLSPQMRQSLKLLELDTGDLRAELFREMAENPVFDDIESIDSHTTGEIERESAAKEQLDASDWPDAADDSADDYFSADADALERRRKFFESRTRLETLEEHLRKQLGTSGLNDTDRQIAEFLIGSLDANGRFTGSLADLIMVTGADEAHIRSILGTIMSLDPPGCGASSLSECLLAQLDKLGDSPYRPDVAELIRNHLDDLAKKDYAAISAATGMSEDRIEDCLELIRTLEPNPGRAYSPPTADEAYVNPEIHAVRDSSGRWIAKVDERDLPEIHINKRYLAMLADRTTPKDVRQYIKSKIEAVEQIRNAIVHRYDTIREISQAIFDAQPEFFQRGITGLKPLTMQEIAQKVGVHHTTVSRTVNGKYASTPFGVVELRSMFIAGIAKDDGAMAAKSDVSDLIRNIVAEENKSSPLSDEKIAAELNSAGFKVARRTVAKYRTALGIPPAQERFSASPPR